MITEITGATSAQGSSTQAKVTNEFDREAFLKLLIVQLRNQDPLEPMEDKEFIAQLAQFSSLEQMQIVNQNLEPFIKMMGPFIQNQIGFSMASWVGRTITALDPDPPKDDNGNEIERVLTAKVESVQFTENGPLLRVKVKEMGTDEETGQQVEVEVEKDISLADVLSVM